MSTAKKHRFPLFYAILVGCVVLALIVTHLLVARLSDYLTEYEAVQPDHLADEIFKTYFKGDIRYAELLERTGYELSPFETEGQLESYLASLSADGEPVMERVSAESDEFRRYVIMVGDTKVAAFNLRRGDAVEFSLFGHKFHKILWLFEANTWSLDKTELFWHASETATVKAPLGSTVMLNGVPVSDAYLFGDPELTDSCSHMPEGVQGLVYVTYRIDKLLYQPYVTVKDSAGRSIPVTGDDAGHYTATVQNDATLDASMRVYVLKAVEAYACYMQEDKSRADLKPYFDTSSALYESIATTTRVVWEHDGYEFQNETIGDFYAYDENTFSCSVGFTHVLIKGSKTWSDEPFSMTIYLRRVGGVFVVYEMVNN